jgi:predicted transposase/invertase (TIGR01784 family)
LNNFANPKAHDSLFKWLIGSFTKEFFSHYFPDIKTGKYVLIDKEFISKYEALKESLKGDIFIAVEIEIEDEIHEVVIHIEHQSKKEDMSDRVLEYFCYIWLMKKKPVWSIVVYTDDAVWRKPVLNKTFCAFDSTNKKQFHKFDVIHINDEKSEELIKNHSLMCKLLALKANDKGTDPEKLIREIFKAAASMKNELNDDIKLLIWQWVGFYKKISDNKVEKIKEEVGMDFVASTITEHYEQQGWLKGKEEGAIEAFKTLYNEGLLSKEQFEKRIAKFNKVNQRASINVAL